MTEEGEIFKSLAHEVRRNIIKALGKKDRSSFTDIKKEIGDIDSPTLSYHLKSLKLLIEQESGQYLLSEIGKIALLLMNRIDQSNLLKQGRRKFLYANIVTQVCWIIILFVIPQLISPYLNMPLSTLIFIIVLLNVIAQINFQVMWRLYGRGPDYSKVIPTSAAKSSGYGENS